jgi:hypothetical protein
MTGSVIWVVDTSSICEVRRCIASPKQKIVFDRMGALVEAGRLTYPKQVVDELERTADPKNPDPRFAWAKSHEPRACATPPSLDSVKKILETVPAVLDPQKDSGPEEADPYILAMALEFSTEGKDVRIASEETKDTPRKMSLRTAAGWLGLSSLPLKAFLKFEAIQDEFP